MPKGYRTKEIIGKRQADQWKDQVDTNNSMIKILEESKLAEEVEKIIVQKKNQNSAEKSDPNATAPGGLALAS